MDQASRTRTLSDYLGILRTHRRLIVIVTLVTAGAALAFSLVREPTYKSDAAVTFEDPAKQAAEVLGQASADFLPQGAAASGTQEIVSGAIVNRVADSLGGEFTSEELRSRVSAVAEPSSNLVTIEATGSTGEESARITNAFAQQTRRVSREEAREFFADRADAVKGDPVGDTVAARLRQLAAVAEPVEIVRPAEVPETPTSPRPARDTVLALFLGLVLGCGAALLRHALDRRITDPHEVQRALSLPLVGSVRAETLGGTGMSPNGTGEVLEDDLEAFRILRTNVDFLSKEGASTVAVTSPLPEEGKSTVAAWYAFANALAGRNTVLVECDFRRPVLARRFELEPSPGLTDFLIDNADPAEVLRSVPVEGDSSMPLAVIPAGQGARQPAELFASQRFEDFIGQIARAYDIVVIDCAPMLPVGDTLELLPLVNTVLLCVRLEQTTRDQAIGARDALSHLPTKPTGLVVTGIRRGSADDYYGYYSYADPRASSPV